MASYRTITALTGRHWRRSGVVLLGALYLLLSVNALTCALGHLDDGSHCAHNDDTAQVVLAEHHGSPDHTVPASGESHSLSLCNCIDKLASAGVPSPILLVSSQPVSRLAPPATSSLAYGSAYQRPSPRGPPLRSA